MSRYIIEGGSPLNGYIEISGAKNAALPVLSATLLVPGISVLKNVPNLTDVQKTLKIMEGLGCKIERDGDKLVIDATNISSTDIDDEIAGEIRSSITLMGALVARCGTVSISYPGESDLNLTNWKIIG